MILREGVLALADRFERCAAQRNKEPFRIAVALAAIIAFCGTMLSCAVSQRGYESTSAPVPTPEPVSAEEAQARNLLPPYIYLDLYLFGQYIHGFSVKDDASKQAVMDAVHDCMIKSEAWPGVDAGVQEDRIDISIKFDDKEERYSVFHVFDKDGKHCMQSGDGMYSNISDAVYKPLHDIAMGYKLPYALTVLSGQNAIRAAGYMISSERKKDGLCADMARYTPRQMAKYIQYIEIEPNGEELTPFTPYAEGKKVYGQYKLYNESFEEIPFPEPSGLEPQTYLLKNAAPGRYIVEMEASFETADQTFCNQYFFGVILPG